MQEHKVPVVHILRCESFHMIEHFKNEDKNAHTEMWLLPYEKVSDQGPVWVRSKEKIPGVYISTHDINVGLPECSLDP